MMSAGWPHRAGQVKEFDAQPWRQIVAMGTFVLVQHAHRPAGQKTDGATETQRIT